MDVVRALRVLPVELCHRGGVESFGDVATRSKPDTKGSGYPRRTRAGPTAEASESAGVILQQSRHRSPEWLDGARVVSPAGSLRVLRGPCYERQ